MCKQRVSTEMEDLNEKFREAMHQLMCTPEFKKCQELSEEIWLASNIKNYVGSKDRWEIKLP